MNLRRRLEALEGELIGNEPIILHTPDGRTEPLRGNVLDLFSRAVHGERTPKVELIAQSISSTEPDGAHMIDLARALLNGPNDGPAIDPNESMPWNAGWRIAN